MLAEAWAGFGYRLDEIERQLPAPVAEFRHLV
jgi:hypothetical protein